MPQKRNADLKEKITVDKATIEIDSEARTCTVCVEPSDDLRAPVETGKAELIATILCLKSRELMALSTQELMARQVSKSFLSSVMLKPETTYGTDPGASMRAMFIFPAEVTPLSDEEMATIVSDEQIDAIFGDSPFVARLTFDKRQYEVVQALNHDWREVVANEERTHHGYYKSHDEAEKIRRRLHARWVLKGEAQR